MKKIIFAAALLTAGISQATTRSLVCETGAGGPKYVISLKTADLNSTSEAIQLVVKGEGQHLVLRGSSSKVSMKSSSGVLHSGYIVVDHSKYKQDGSVAEGAGMVELTESLASINLNVAVNGKVIITTCK